MLTLAEQHFGMKRNVMAYSLGQAAKAAGISKTSLHRAIQKGRVSAAKNDNAHYQSFSTGKSRVLTAKTRP
jgi:hypothetical protein